MSPPTHKGFASELTNRDTSKEKKKVKIKSSANDKSEVKQQGSKVRLGFKYLKEAWLHKKQPPSAMCPILSVNQPSLEEMTQRRTQILNTDEKVLLKQTAELLEVGNGAAVRSQHSLSTDCVGSVVNQNKESQHSVNDLEKIIAELLQKNLELTERNSKMVIIIQNLENNEKILQESLAKDSLLQEKLQSSQAQVARLQQELLESDDTNRDLKQEVFDLIHSIHSKDDSNIIMSLKKEISKREHMIKDSVDAGDILLEEMENCRKLLKDIGKEIRINWTRLKTRRHTLVDLFHISRGCISELSRQVVFIHNDTESTLGQIQGEFLKQQQELSKEKDQNFVLKEKLENEVKLFKQESQQNTELKEKLKKLEDQIKDLEERLQNTKNIYETQIEKANSEYSLKLAAAFEKQEFLQHHVTQTLADKGRMFDELKLIQKENSTLLSSNKMHEIQIHNLRENLESSQEIISTLKSKLQTETEANSEMKQKLEEAVSKAEELEKKCKEHECGMTDGETWCSSMHRQDQAIVQALEVCLQEKEQLINTLCTQGECDKADLEKLQAEVNIRKAKMDELKCVLADFEKKREHVVNNQKEFYAKIKELNKTASLRERVCENLVKESENKSQLIKMLESKLDEAENIILEIKEQGQNEMNELKSELKGAVERLREYENHVETMDRDLERQILVMQNNLAEETLQKNAALEKLDRHQKTIDELKKDNGQICSHLQRCEAQKKDLEKLVEKYHKEKLKFKRTEVLEQELRHRVTSAEAQAQETRRNLEVKICSLDHSLKQISALQKKLQEIQNDLTESQNTAQKTKLELTLIQEEAKMLTFEKQQLEIKLDETTKDKNFLHKDHEELCNKLISSVKMLMEAKLSHQQFENEVHNLKRTIFRLQDEKKHAEDELECLKETLNKKYQTIKMLEEEKHELCNEIERFVDNPKNYKESKQTLEYQDCIKRLNKQLSEAKEDVRTMRHKYTQEFLHLQADKQRLEEFVEQVNDKHSNVNK